MSARRRRLSHGVSLGRRLLGILAPQRGLIVAAAVLTMVTSLLGLVPLVLVKALLDRLSEPRVPLGELSTIALGITLTAVVLALLNVAQAFLQARITENVVCELRDRLFGNLVDQSVGFWVRRRSGEMTSRILNDVGAIDSLLANATLTLLGSGLRAAGLIVLSFVLDWRLALLVLVIVPLSLAPIRRAAKRIGVAQRRVQEQLSEVTSYLQEMLSVSGAELVRAHDRRAFERARFSRLNRELRRREVAAAMSSRWFEVSITVVAAAAPAIMLLAGGYLISHSDESVGTVVVVSLVLTTQLGLTVRTAGSTLTNLMASVPVWERIFAALDEQPDLDERTDPVELEPGEVAGAISFEDVDFRYPGQIRPALEDVRVDIAPGTFVAVVGPTGAGKSTFGALIARLIDPEAGAVRLDGHDLRDLSFDTLARSTGMVFQDTFLFHASVADNLRYARPEATDDDLWTVLRDAQLDDVVARMADGLATLVGERGHRLSGGEQQRLSIARAILQNPPVLILDEATSHLDNVVERAVLQALRRRYSGRTTVAIAHRLTTVRDADQILVLDEHRIVARGTHEELMASGGVYARLYEAQAEPAPTTGSSE